MVNLLASMFGLEGKVAVVTGGAVGIGAGIATVLAEAGAWVVIADRDRDGAARCAAELVDRGLDATPIVLDLADEDSVVTACASIVTDVGTPWLLVNNAGVQDRQFLLDTSACEWDRIHAVNSRGAFLMTRELARPMVAAGAGGRIVNIASNCLRGGIIKGLAAYTTSKGALAALSLVTAFELAEHGITVNTVLPGGVVTPGAINASGPLTDGPATRPVPFGLQEPCEIGGAVLYLASPIARAVTNQVLAVDGGFSVS
jgi:NAD(P)-dependent dehydrogenase (short-subunit alcohol dehydrogenase family)